MILFAIPPTKIIAPQVHPPDEISVSQLDFVRVTSLVNFILDRAILRGDKFFKSEKNVFETELVHATQVTNILFESMVTFLFTQP